MLHFVPGFGVFLRNFPRLLPRSHWFSRRKVANRDMEKFLQQLPPRALSSFCLQPPPPRVCLISKSKWCILHKMYFWWIIKVKILLNNFLQESRHDKTYWKAELPRSMRWSISIDRSIAFFAIEINLLIKPIYRDRDRKGLIVIDLDCGDT